MNGAKVIFDNGNVSGHFGRMEQLLRNIDLQHLLVLREYVKGCFLGQLFLYNYDRL